MSVRKRSPGFASSDMNQLIGIYKTVNVDVGAGEHDSKSVLLFGNVWCSVRNTPGNQFQNINLHTEGRDYKTFTMRYSEAINNIEADKTLIKYLDRWYWAKGPFNNINQENYYLEITAEGKDV